MRHEVWAWVFPLFLLAGAVRAEPGVTDSRIVIGNTQVAPCSWNGRYDAGGFEIGYSAAIHSGSRYVDLTVIDGSGRFLR